MKYRAEIDGLRALAVVPVILFHAGLGGMKGGFAGVDVFFVISGYLITSIIYEEIKDRRFSILRFYERRARRIAPALLFVCLVCLPFAWFWMLPRELREFGRSLYHVCLFVSNFFFWRRSDYFDLDNALRPLLHTWSLAVEEQFYIFFPLILMGMRKFRREATVWLLVALSIVSFAATLVVHPIDPVANFYLLPTRFWELGVGAVLALSSPGEKLPWKRYRGLLAELGFVLIILSYFTVEEGHAYPSWQTLPVVLGTALVLGFASSSNWTGRLLSLRPVVFVGLISYSLYLWHQPVLAFARLSLLDAEVSATTAAMLIGLSVVLAVISYVFVEMPFRNRHRITAGRIFGLTGAVASLCIAAGIGLEVSKGVPSRVPVSDDMVTVSIGLSKECDGNILPSCSTSERAEVAVWGDSFAGHLVDGLIAAKPDLGLVQMNESACGPFLDLALEMPAWKQGWSQDCLEHNAAVLGRMARTPSLRYVVVGLNVSRYPSEPRLWRAGVGWVIPTREMITQSFLASLERLRSMGLSPVVFAPPPQTGQDAGACVSRSLLLGTDPAACNLAVEAVDRWDGFAQELMQSVSAQFPVVTLRPHLCGSNTCRVTEDGIPVYADKGHFSRAGIKLLGRKLDLYQTVVDAATKGCAGGAAIHPSGFCAP